MILPTTAKPLTAHPGKFVAIPPPGKEWEGIEIISEDGEPLESNWHRMCMNLLIESAMWWNRHRTDYYVGGNMFLYFSPERARNRDFRGPDFFFVDGGVERYARDYWAIWQENDRYPDALIELTSPTTKREDWTRKFEIYEQTFRSRNYFICDPETRALDGWELNAEGRYEKLQPNEAGWLWSSVLGLWVGEWQGEYSRYNMTWLRFYDVNGQVVQIEGETARDHAAAEQQRADAERHRADAERHRADAERHRADAERHRADAAEAELARLKAQLAKHTKNGGPAV